MLGVEMWRWSGRVARGFVARRNGARWFRSAMDVESATAPVPVPQAPESVPPLVQEGEEVIISDVPETEAPSSALEGDVSETVADTTMEGAPSTSKRAPRQYVPPQKGTTVFPLARVSKIIKVRRAANSGRQRSGHLQQRGDVFDQCCYGTNYMTNSRSCLSKSSSRKDARMHVWTNAKWSATTIWVRRSHSPPAKAAQQNEYLDFLRDVVPVPIPLSVAMQQRADLAQSGAGHALEVAAETPGEEAVETPAGASHAESQDLDHVSGVASEPAPYVSIPEVPASSGQPVESKVPATQDSLPSFSQASQATHAPSLSAPADAVNISSAPFPHDSSTPMDM